MRQFDNAIDFLNQQNVIDSINKNDFSKVYELADEQTFGQVICKITKIFEEAGLDPLKYVDEVPRQYRIADVDITDADLSKYDNIYKIAANAFYYCSNIEKVIIGKNISEIGADAFSFCEKLHDLDILSTDIKIHSRAFEDCANLSNVNMIDAVVEINSRSFANCKNLKYINYSGSMSNWQKYCNISPMAFSFSFQGIRCKDGFIDWWQK